MTDDIIRALEESGITLHFNAEGSLLLPCGHTLCQACLQLCQDELGQDGPGCTECYGRELLDSVLKGLLDSLFQGQPRRVGNGVEGGEMAEDGDLCRQHGERLTQYCMEDEELICDQCQGEEHEAHECSAIEEATQEWQYFLRVSPPSGQSQAQNTVRLIKENFEKLHQFLHDEEISMLRALSEEEEKKKFTFLFMNIQFQSLATASKLILPVTKLGIPVKPSAPVILDPNTADVCVALSDDLTTIRYTEEEQQVPDNPERFCFYDCALGSEGLGSGRHSWDVEVGDCSEWALGVVKESVQRKEWFPPSPERGMWTICLYGGEYSARSATSAPLTLKKKPQKIRVQLDWEAGRVMFSDAGDNSLLYKYKHKFTEQVFPYFSNTCKRHPLHILAEKVSVYTE
uniref:E3 ubiquitin-protein ligase TRIM39-like n=1 Tax=Sinocyclocheilus grahami TaxID=75366 RepID=A0A672LZN4_SINGR